MYKGFFVVALAVAVFLVFGTHIEGAERSTTLEPNPEEVEEEEERALTGEVGDLDLELDYWMVHGSQSWYKRIPVPYPGPIGRKQVYPVETDFWVLSAEYRFLERWSIDASYGFGDLDKRTGSDRRWFHGYSPLPSMTAIFDNSGDAYFWIADLNYRVLAKDSSYLDAFLGYQFNKNSFKMKNGWWTTVAYTPVSIPMPPLMSSYEIEYQGVRLGLRGEMPLSSNPEWTLEGSVAYLPWLEAEGDGVLNFGLVQYTQTDGDGEGVDASIAVNYKPAQIPNLAFKVGYRYMELETRGGNITDYTPIGPIAGDWHNGKCKFNGVFFGVGYRF